MEALPANLLGPEFGDAEASELHLTGLFAFYLLHLTRLKISHKTKKPTTLLRVGLPRYIPHWVAGEMVRNLIHSREIITLVAGGIKRLFITTTNFAQHRGGLNCPEIFRRSISSAKISPVKTFEAHARRNKNNVPQRISFIADGPWA